jgi:hypothetical protein
MRMLRRVGLGLFALQLLGLLLWSSFVYHRFSLTPDYVGAAQAWYLMAHGHLNPFVSDWGEHWLTDHSEAFIALLAPLWWIWPHAILLLWVQDLVVVVAGIVAFLWMIDYLEHRYGSNSIDGPRRYRHSLAARAHDFWKPRAATTLLGSMGLLLLLLNPWPYWAASFDLHGEVFGACFAILTAYDISRRRRRAWLWAVLTLSCGDVGATYLFGVGLSALLAGRATRRIGLAICGVGLGAVLLVTAAGANTGSGLGVYAPGQPGAPSTGVHSVTPILKAFFTRPLAYFHPLRQHALNIYANIAPVGAVGLATAWGFGVPFVVLVSNNLRPGLSITASQNMPIYLFIALGTVMIVAVLSRRLPTLALALVAVIAVNAIAWSAVWVPRTKDQWVRVSSGAARILSDAAARIPVTDEVVASHGVSGSLAARPYFETLYDVVPIYTHTVWFVVAPEQGIEVVDVPDELAELANVARIAHLVEHGSGIWVFRYHPRTTQKLLRLETPGPFRTLVRGWEVPGPAGRAVTTGRERDWDTTATGAKGYVVSGDYWRAQSGSYRAVVSLTSEGPTEIQLWDSTANRLLWSEQMSTIPSPTVVESPAVEMGEAVGEDLYGGSLMFRITPIPPPAGDNLEVRVWSPGGHSLTVYGMKVRQVQMQRGRLALTPGTPVKAGGHTVPYLYGIQQVQWISANAKNYGIKPADVTDIEEAYQHAVAQFGYKRTQSLHFDEVDQQEIRVVRPSGAVAATYP